MDTKVHYHGQEEVGGAGGHSVPPPYTSGVPPGADGRHSVPPPYTSGVPPGADGLQHGLAMSYGPNVVHTTHHVGVVGTNVGVVGATATFPTVIVRQQNISPKPTKLTCQSCHCEIITRTETKATMKTHLFAGLLCLCGCWCCVCIPYCTDSCLNSDHYCPNCNAYIGTHQA